MQKLPKRLIEVDLPIKRISAHARREKSIRNGHISTLHIWWARRPLAACRAVLCASLWPDPVDPLCPGEFKKIAQEEMLTWANKNIGLLSGDSFSRFVKIQKDPSLLKDGLVLRKALLDFIADFSNWDNSTVSQYLESSRKLTQVAHESLGGIAGARPMVVDPFAGGGSIPLEALRIGAEAYASDLNPIPVLLNKVILQYIPRYKDNLSKEIRRSGESIALKLREALDCYYIKDNSEEIPYSYLWARTIVCEGPGCGYEFPLIRSLWLRQKEKDKVILVLNNNLNNRKVDVDVVSGFTGKNAGMGTSKQGAATCPVCGYTTSVESVREQLAKKKGGSIDAQFLAVSISNTNRSGKKYRKPTEDEINRYHKAQQRYYSFMQDRNQDSTTVIPNEELNHLRGFFNVVLYGMKRWGDLFSPRQAILMATLVELVKEEYNKLRIIDQGLAEAVTTCLALIASKVAQYNSNCCRWKSKGETLIDMFGRQAIPMVWDYAEAYPFSGSTGDYRQYLNSFCNVLNHMVSIIGSVGIAEQASATSHPLPDNFIDAFVTDPPYYDAIPYADLSDYFYVWLRRMLRFIHYELFEGILSPKDDECVALSHRAAMYRNKDRKYFENTMKAATREGRRITKPSGIGVFVFANKSTSGWEAMLSALIDSGWIITASWAIDTEMSSRLRARDSAVLASSIHLVCRPRENPDGSLRTDLIGDWRDVLQELPICIHEWMPRLAENGVVGADAIFACLGPALEVFSRYSVVEKPNGDQVVLKEYMEHVWAAISREALSVVFSEADASGFEEDSRLTAIWLWTLSTAQGRDDLDSKVTVALNRDELSEDESSDDEKPASKTKSSGYLLEYDTARKIAQGLGAHLDKLNSIVEIKGDTARLLPVEDRARYLFGKTEEPVAVKKKNKAKQAQPSLFDLTEDYERDASPVEPGMRQVGAPLAGATALDRVHQSMLLFATGRAEALKRFLVEDGIGHDQRFWKLAQALSALYPPASDEKRWVDGVLARKKGLGL